MLNRRKVLTIAPLAGAAVVVPSVTIAKQGEIIDEEIQAILDYYLDREAEIVDFIKTSEPSFKLGEFAKNLADTFGRPEISNPHIELSIYGNNHMYTKAINFEIKKYLGAPNTNEYYSSYDGVRLNFCNDTAQAPRCTKSIIIENRRFNLQKIS